jgi:DNA sulfur modification protein DndC
MEQALRDRLDELDDQILMITGERQGESAIRDRHIEMSCGKDGAECGQGWCQKVLPNAKRLRGRLATLAPLLHWRVCHVWAWLKNWALAAEFGDWSTAMISDAYGGDEAEEINVRTSYIGYALALEDKALDSVLMLPAWSYLAPPKGLCPLVARTARDAAPPAQSRRRAAEGRKHRQEPATHGADQARSAPDGTRARAGHSSLDQCRSAPKAS